MDMPGRNVTPIDPYRYGNNGQEREKETFEGAYSADFWGYDSRLGRRWEQDPLAYTWQSPYVAFNDNPIYFADPFGLEATGDKDKGNGKGNSVRGSSSDNPFSGRKAFDSDPNPAAGGQKGNVITMFGQNKHSDAIPLTKLADLSSQHKNHIRNLGMVNAMTSNQVFGIGRRDPKSLGMNPADQATYLQGQMAGDIASMIIADAEITTGGAMVTSGAAITAGGMVVSGTGVGAIFGAGGVILGQGLVATGGVMVAHGSAVIVVATAQLAKTITLLSAVTYNNGNPAAAASDGGGSATSSDAQSIGSGHAYDKHVVKEGQFPGVKDKQGFIKIINDIMTSPNSLYKQLSNGRSAWYDKVSNTVIIRNPNAGDKGTCFKPGAGAGEAYFNNLK